MIVSDTLWRAGARCRHLSLELMPRRRDRNRYARGPTACSRTTQSLECLAELFRSGADPLTIIRWKDIHEQLEEAVDACENAADVLEAILVKNR